MQNWFLLTLMALLLFGIQRFLYKVSAERNCNTAWTTFAFMGTVTILSTLSFFVFGQSIHNLRFLLFISLINSLSFVSGTIATIEALKYISTSVAYPLIRLNTAIVVVFSIIYFKDKLSLFQILGIIVAITVILILTRLDDGSRVPTKAPRRAMILVIVALFSGAIAAISSKFAALEVNLLAFMAISYGMSMIVSLCLRKKLGSVGTNHNEALIIGILIGLVNFGGFYSLLKALSSGPLSIIIPITGMYFVISIVLAFLFYREKLNTQRVAAIVLTAFAIILMRL
jgi:drug/metabolite transporter (DMT)-like permease